LLYGILVLILLYRAFQFFRLLFRRKLTRKYFITGLQQIIFFFLLLYILFNLFWGLNYDRKGIADQLGLAVKPYSAADLDTITTIIQERVNQYATDISEAQRDSFDRKKTLFNASCEAYK